MGANWIHGVLGNPMYEVAMANGLIDIVSVPKQHTVIAATEDGHQVPHPILQVGIISISLSVVAPWRMICNKFVPPLIRSCL